MDIVDPNIEAYCIAHSKKSPSVLHRLERETHLKTIAPQMLSGSMQGQFLGMLCRMINPRKVLEIGTFTGYSAISMALESPDHTHIDTIEVNPELENMIRRYLAEAGVEGKVTLHIGNALELVDRLEGPYDLAFIDAAKTDYTAYFEQVIRVMRRGAFILSDNVLWDGKVLSRSEDAETAAISQYNRMLRDDPRVEVLMLPLRDGISIARVV